MIFVRFEGGSYQVLGNVYQDFFVFLSHPVFKCHCALLLQF